MTAARHLVFLVEEPSMEAFLRTMLLRYIGNREFDVHAFQGKDGMLRRLEGRLRAYASGAIGESRIVVLVDRDGENCHCLKEKLEAMAHRAGAGLRSRTRPGRRCWNIVNRIVIEELEAWYFGDWPRGATSLPASSGRYSRESEVQAP